MISCAQCTHTHTFHTLYTSVLPPYLRARRMYPDFNFIQFSSSKFFHVATMCHRTEAVKHNIKWPVVYPCNTQLILRSPRFIFLFLFFLSKIPILFCLHFGRYPEVACYHAIDVYIDVCFCCIWLSPSSVLHANTFDPAAACDTFLHHFFVSISLALASFYYVSKCFFHTYIFSIALWLLLIATSQAILTYTHPYCYTSSSSSTVKSCGICISIYACNVRPFAYTYCTKHCH